MYEQFFGLKQKPFSVLPDPRFLYTSRTHKAALNLLEYGLAEQAGFVVLTGEVGTGKTTLLRQLLHQAADDIIVGLITNTHASFGDLLKWILLAFDLDCHGDDQIERHKVLIDFVIECYAEGRRCVLVIDEAQNLSVAAIEQLRMLSNINSEADHLLQIFLVGQPELRNVLMQRELRQFVQRIGIDYDLKSLTVEETTQCIAHRLAVAGASRRLFTDQAAIAVHYFSRGIPRLINNLCDMALLYAYADDLPEVDIDTVVEAVAVRAQGGLTALTALPEASSPEQLKARILERAVSEPDSRALP